MYLERPYIIYNFILLYKITGFAPGVKQYLDAHPEVTKDAAQSKEEPLSAENLLTPMRTCMRETDKLKRGTSVDFVRGGRNNEQISVLLDGQEVCKYDSNSVS